MQQNSQVRSANRIEVRFDGKVVGLIQSVQMNDDYSPDAASGVGDIHVVEHVATVARHSLSVQAMALKKQSLRSAGIAVENGDGALQGLVFDFITIDKESGEVLRTYRGCTYAGGSVDVRKHAIVLSSASFLALDVSGLGI